MNNLVALGDLEGFEIIDIRQYENNERDRPDFDNKYLKIFYFIINEGFFSTIRKYKAHKNKQQRFLTFLTVEAKGNKYINISIQYQDKPKDFVIKNQFYYLSNTRFEDIENNSDQYFEKFNQFGECESYAHLNIDTANPISFRVVQEEFSDVAGKGLFIYGLGGYVKMFIIHHFKNMPKLACIDYKANVTKEFKDKYNFKYSFLTPARSFPLLKKVESPVAIIATYHSDHSSLAYEIFKANPKTTIFIEKPPTVTLGDLDKLIELFNLKARLEIGFNRRFINFSSYVKERAKNKVVIITCSIKEVLINDNHWYLWKNQGTRITGNVVHWFDLANWWIQSKPIEINVMANPADPETSAISVLYENGSIVNLTASDKGNSLRGVQEKIEIRFDNETIFINDFTELTHIKKDGVKLRKTKLIRNKGHNAMYQNFLSIIDNKKNSTYSAFDLINTSIVTYYASEMVVNNIRSKNIKDEIEAYLKKII